MLRQSGNGSLDIMVDLPFPPVLELRANCELRREFRAMSLEPLVRVTSSCVKPVQLEFDPVGVRGVKLCVPAVKRDIVAQPVSLPAVPPAERCRSRFELRGAVGLFLRGRLVMSLLALEPDRAGCCVAIQVGDGAADRRAAKQFLVCHGSRLLSGCGECLLERGGAGVPE